jgi:hypothetical protein
MAKLPDYIPISPVTLVCPRCKAKPGRACDLLDGEVEIVHIERIAAAAKGDVAAKRVQKSNG